MWYSCIHSVKVLIRSPDSVPLDEELSIQKWSDICCQNVHSVLVHHVPRGQKDMQLQYRSRRLSHGSTADGVPSIYCGPSGRNGGDWGISPSGRRTGVLVPRGSGI